ncbi:DUF2523 family protein [Dyella soli]|nr:DUF2523 family protein [Dyella soli]
MLLTVGGEMLIRALVGAGVGIATYAAVVAPVKAQIQARFGAAGDLAQYIGFLGIDVAVTIVLSAWIGRNAVSASKAFFVKRAS